MTYLWGVFWSKSQSTTRFRQTFRVTRVNKEPNRPKREGTREHEFSERVGQVEGVESACKPFEYELLEAVAASLCELVDTKCIEDVGVTYT
jgi:hypothetical protein